VTSAVQPVLPAAVAAYWREACVRHGIAPTGPAHFSMFGAPDMADELAALVCITRSGEHCFGAADAYTSAV